MTRTRRAWVVIATMISMVASVVILAQPAQADYAGSYTAVNVSSSPPSGSACNTSGWVHVCFEAYGDEIWVKDARRDGYHADVAFWWTSSAEYICHNRHGSAAGWTVCDGLHNLIPENEYITLWAWEADSNEDIVSGSGARLESSTS